MFVDLKCSENLILFQSRLELLSSVLLLPLQCATPAITTTTTATTTVECCGVQCLGLSEEELLEREVDYVDIAFDELAEKHYKVEEVCR